MARKPQKPENPVAATEAGPDEYIVTAKAPSRVAGRQVKADDTMRLTEEQARAELLAGHIRPAGMPERVKKDAPSTAV